MNKEYFCSYKVFRQSTIFAYGDIIIDFNFDDANELLGSIKSHIKNKYCEDEKGIDVVIVSLNKL